MFIPLYLEGIGRETTIESGLKYRVTQQGTFFGQEATGFDSQADAGTRLYQASKAIPFQCLLASRRQ
jgi:hypothetical protein